MARSCLFRFFLSACFVSWECICRNSGVMPWLRRSWLVARTLVHSQGLSFLHTPSIIQAILPYLLSALIGSHFPVSRSLSSSNYTSVFPSVSSAFAFLLLTIERTHPLLPLFNFLLRLFVLLCFLSKYNFLFVK